MSNELVPLAAVVKPLRPRVKPSVKAHLPFIGMEHIEAHTMKLLGTAPASSMKSAAVHFMPGDVLYGRLRPYLNKVYRPQFEGLCSAEFIVLPESEKVDGAYLQYFLNSAAFTNFASHLNAGDRPRVDFDQIAAYPIPLPPLAVQRQIIADVDKQFSRLDEAVGNLQRAKARLKRYKRAVLKAAVEGRLVEVEASIARRENRAYESGEVFLQRVSEARRIKWIGRWREPAAHDSGMLPALPEGWTWASLDSLSWHSSYGTSAKCSYEDRGTPILRIPNVQHGELDWSDLKFAPTSLLMDVADTVSPGDLLVIRTNGSKSLVGRAAIAKSDLPRQFGFASYLIRFRLADVVDLPNWLAVVWPEGRMRSWLESRAATSAGQHNISQRVLATAPIPLPPVGEQRRIVAEVDRRLSIVREVEAEVDANLKRAQSLRQATLAKAFGA